MTGGIARALGIAVGLAVPLCACASASGPPPSDPQTGLYGISKARLSACAGAPAASSSLEEVEYLVYRGKFVVGRNGLADLPTLPVIGSLAMGDPGHEVTCEATLVIRNDRVEAVTYRTDPPQNSKEAAAICRPVLQACLAPKGAS